MDFGLKTLNLELLNPFDELRAGLEPRRRGATAGPKKPFALAQEFTGLTSAQGSDRLSLPTSEPERPIDRHFRR